MPKDQPQIGEKNSEKSMSFFDHVDELRSHILRSLVYVVVIAIIAFVFIQWIFTHIIIAPLSPNFITYQLFCDFSNNVLKSDVLCFAPDRSQFTIQNLTVQGQFLSAMKMALIIGVVLAFPIIIREVWQFVKPGLSKKEIKNMRGLTFFTSILFFLGVLFGYYIILPMALNFLTGFSLAETGTLTNNYKLSDTVNFIVSMSFLTGVAFELPMILYFLGRIGLISVEFLKKYRKHAVIILLVLSAIITPPDIMSQIILGLPLYGLYEIGIKALELYEKKQTNKKDD